MSNTYSIPLPSLFNNEECLWFLSRNFDDCIYRIKQNNIVRLIQTEETPVLIEISLQPTTLQVTCLSHELTPDIKTDITAFLYTWFDLEIDIDPFYKKLEQQQALAYMTDQFKGLYFIGIPDFFEALCWSIIGQQINLKFAYTLKRRLVERYGIYLTYEGEKYYLFPSPEAILDIPLEDFRAMQFSGSKAQYLFHIAEAFVQQNITKEILQQLPDTHAKQKRLTDIKGIGVWTAQYALMKGLKVRDSIPHGDAGLLRALLDHRLIQDKTDRTSIDLLFNDFEGWESYLVFYLWRSLSPKP